MSDDFGVNKVVSRLDRYVATKWAQMIIEKKTCFHPSAPISATPSIGIVVRKSRRKCETNKTFAADKHFVGLEAKLIVAMLVSRYEVHVEGGGGTALDPYDPASFAGVRLTVINRNEVRETSICASLRRLDQDKKFLFF